MSLIEVLFRDQRTAKTRVFQEEFSEVTLKTHKNRTLQIFSQFEQYFCRNKFLFTCDILCNSSNSISKCLDSEKFGFCKRRKRSCQSSRRYFWSCLKKLKEVLFITTCLILLSFPSSSAAPRHRRMACNVPSGSPKWVHPCGAPSEPAPQKLELKKHYLEATSTAALKALVNTIQAKEHYETTNTKNYGNHTEFYNSIDQLQENLQNTIFKKLRKIAKRVNNKIEKIAVVQLFNSFQKAFQDFQSYRKQEKIDQAQKLKSDADSLNNHYQRNLYEGATHWQWLPILPNSKASEEFYQHVSKDWEEILLDLYRYLQTYAVGLEQVTFDLHNNPIDDLEKTFLEIENLLKNTLCELYSLLTHHGVRIESDVSRDVMPENQRCESSQTNRVMRDWIILSEYLNSLEFMNNVLEYLRNK